MVGIDRAESPKVARRVLVLAVATALVVGLTPISSQAGWIRDLACTTGQQLVGVWVDLERGTDHWGWWKPDNGVPHRANGSAYGSWSSDRIGSGTKYRLVVGCGGTQQNWQHSVRSGWMTGPKHVYCVVNYYGNTYCRGY